MRERVSLLVVAVVAAAVAEPAWAIPAFARRYKVECHFCHEGFPKLNTIGQRFKERGFRMEREDDFDASKWLSSVPVAVRANARRDFGEGQDATTTSFIKGISAGNLGKRVSYWVDDGIFIQETPKGAGSDFKNVTHIKPDNAWLRVEVVSGGKLYVRAGRIEMDIPFTQTRTSHLFGYDIYFANTGFETDTIGDYQEGLEIGGDLPRDVHWSAAVVKGRNSNAAEALSKDAGKFDGNLFLRLAKRVDRHRFGAFAYVGRNTLAREPGVVWKDGILRLGADVNVWYKRLNLYGVYIYGRNDNSIAGPARPSGTQEPLSYNGGFAQADYHIGDVAALTLRLNVVSQPGGTTSRTNETFSSLFPGIQVFVFEHGKISFEYGFLGQQRKSFGAVQAEVAF